MKKKYYVVWKGRNPGIYHSWDACKKEVEGFKGAQYKAFDTLVLGQEAIKKPFTKVISTSKKIGTNGSKPLPGTIVVDAAWNTKTGDMEYQGVEFDTGRKLFAQGPFEDGTNNIGEFLAIVHALAFLKKTRAIRPFIQTVKLPFLGLFAKEQIPN